MLSDKIMSQGSGATMADYLIISGIMVSDPTPTLTIPVPARSVTRRSDLVFLVSWMINLVEEHLHDLRRLHTCGVMVLHTLFSLTQLHLHRKVIVIVLVVGDTNLTKSNLLTWQ